jgi:hypothetical protein
MTPAALLSKLTARGVEFQVDGDKLNVRTEDPLKSDELAMLRRHKPAILALLQGNTRAAAPIIEGTEHFCLWVDDADGHRPEFVPGLHYDVRQPRRLAGPCSPFGNPNMRSASYPSLLTVCDRCGATEFTNTEIHEGRSLRRDCAKCNRFMGWPRWYGRLAP